jgi:hypothetical protein
MDVFFPAPRSTYEKTRAPKEALKKAGIFKNPRRKSYPYLFFNDTLNISTPLYN